jgi:hypothetical protein
VICIRNGVKPIVRLGKTRIQHLGGGGRC